MKLRYTSRALNDLAGIAGWLTQSGAGPRAERRLNHIASSIDGLVEHPSVIGLTEPDGASLQLRGTGSVTGYSPTAMCR